MRQKTRQQMKVQHIIVSMRVSVFLSHPDIRTSGPLSSVHVCAHFTVGQNDPEYRLKYWATCSSIRSFARTAHLFPRSALLASLARSTPFTRSLARGAVNDWMAFFFLYFFPFWTIVCPHFTLHSSQKDFPKTEGVRGGWRSRGQGAGFRRSNGQGKSRGTITDSHVS